MALHFISFLFSVSSMVLLIMANIGTTFSSSSLNKIYLVELKDSTTSRSIRYGVYDSCLYYNNSAPQSCTSRAPAYSFDATQFATMCGASSDNSTYTTLVSSSNVNSLFKTIVIILPTTLFAFIAFSCTLLLRKNRENNLIPLIGSFASLFSFLIGAAGLVLVLVVFLKGLPALEKQVDGLSHQWGGAIYLFGIGVLCTLGTFICFLVSFFIKDPSANRDTFILNDYSSTTKANDTFSKEDGYIMNNKEVQGEATPPVYYPQTEPTPYQPVYAPPQSPTHNAYPQSPTASGYPQAPHTYDAYPQSPTASGYPQAPQTYDAYPTQPYHQEGHKYDQNQPY